MDTELLIALGSVAAALFVIIGWRTAAGRYGKVRPNGEVAEAYECYRVEGHLAYYTSGSEIYPNAIIGIEKTWTLDSDLWQPRNLSPGEMRELVQNMQNKSALSGLTLFGFDLFDSRGEKIGNCFSSMEAVTTVKITGDRTVVVHTPPLNTYRDS